MGRNETQGLVITPTSSTTHKSKLNTKQLKLLLTIYTFRYGTAELVAKHIGVTRRSMSNSLNVLEDRGFLHRRFNGRYHLMHKPASYCLTPQAIRALRSSFKVNEDVLHNIYADRTATQAFVDHSLGVFQTCLDLHRQYPDKFNIMTTSHQANYDDFPRPKPDLYMGRIKKLKTKPNEYFVDVYEDDVEIWIIKKRIRLYILHQESYEWEEDDYPTVILVVNDEKKHKKLKRYAKKLIEEHWLEDELVIKVSSAVEFTNL